MTYTIEKTGEDYHSKYKLKREMYQISLPIDDPTIMRDAFEQLINALDFPYNAHKVGTKLILGEKTIHIEFKKILTPDDIMKRITLIAQSSKEIKPTSVSVIFSFI
jgi:hypothetical protein